jgi:hypothetical protein
LNKHFQDRWAIKLLWAKCVLSSNGKVAQVQCQVCTWIEGKDKLFVPKLDCLCNHVGHCKVLVAILGVEIKTSFFEMRSCILPNVLKQCCNKSFMMQLRLIGKKLVQFVLIFHLFNHGYPMTKYATMQKLFVQLNVPIGLMKQIVCVSKFLKKTQCVVVGGRLGNGKLYVQVNSKKNSNYYG